ncbi:MAG TPA: sigma-70 family RNA polymerase sigma factor [Candidatus Dormibacteraeota bacterium]|nr:sigma-70 family RNA polymerase sigma factor [Candidatus Dormibacteraeota bacterium]
MTGLRRDPITRRRVQGAHKELKRLLVEGRNEGGDGTRRWIGFSGAMKRHSVEEAMATLPPRQKQLIKLAYFSDLSNREIAQGLGITVSSVERGLRQAIARVSVYVEHGRVVGRRILYGLALFLSGRWLTDTAHQAAGPSTGELVRVGALTVAVATAGAILISQPVPPGQLSTIDKGGTPAISSAMPLAVLQGKAVKIPHVTAAAVEATKSRAGKAVKVVPAAVTLPVPVEIPPVHVEEHHEHIKLPEVPIVQELLRA